MTWSSVETRDESEEANRLKHHVGKTVASNVKHQASILYATLSRELLFLHDETLANNSAI